MLELHNPTPATLSLRTLALVILHLLLATPTLVLAKDRNPSPIATTILSVSDGDTVVVQINGSKERVRLIGIDAPESHSNRRAIKQANQSHQDLKTILALGQRASEFSKSLMPAGAAVSLEFDLERRDRYGRLLAYIWLADGRMANDVIIRSGYAYPLTIPPNIKYRERFSAAFSESRQEERGLWAGR